MLKPKALDIQLQIYFCVSKKYRTNISLSPSSSGRIACTEIYKEAQILYLQSVPHSHGNKEQSIHPFANLNPIFDPFLSKLCRSIHNSRLFASALLSLRTPPGSNPTLSICEICCQVLMEERYRRAGRWRLKIESQNAVLETGKSK